MSNNRKNKTISFETVKTLIIKEKYDKAFNEAPKLSCSDFKHFIEELILPHFEELFNSTNAENYLHTYFSKCYKCGKACISEKFEQKLAQEFPELFVKAIRVNEVFLKRENIDAILSYTLPKEFQIHNKVWKLMRKQEDSLWKGIHKSMQSVLNLDIEEVLVNIVLWLEEKYNKQLLSQDSHHLASVYSLFMRYYLSNKEVNEIDEGKLSTIYSKRTSRIFIRKKTNSKINTLLKKISDYIKLRDGNYLPYCFDREIKLSEENGIIYFIRSAEEYYRWELDGKRYEFNRIRYAIRASEELYQVNIDGFFNNNAEAFHKKYSLLIEDLKVDNFPQYFFNNHSNKTADNRSLMIQSLKKVGSENLPYIVTTQKEYISYQEELSGLNYTILKDCTYKFSYEIKYNPESFDRFSTTHYNTLSTPCIRIQNNDKKDVFLFCPTLFWADNEWFYNAALMGIKDLEGKKNDSRRNKSTEKQEKYLADIFREKGFDVTIINDHNKIDGDVDIIVSDKNNDDTLFIQLKRPYFRLNLKDAYNEYILVDRKAAQQLNDAEESLSKENDTNFQLKSTIKPTKWIVTTSYENTFSDIEGCKKINYFDLLAVLRRSDEIENFNSLNNFILLVENDTILKNDTSYFIDEITDENHKEIVNLMNNVGLPLKIVEPKEYRQPILLSDRKKLEVNNIYNKALELQGKGKIEKAIKVLEKYIASTPTNMEGYGALANMYADIEDYENSFKTFEKALTITPNDPFVKKNYAGTLLMYFFKSKDHTYFHRAEKLTKELYEDYWFIEVIRNSYKTYVDGSVKELSIIPYEMLQKIGLSSQ